MSIAPAQPTALWPADLAVKVRAYDQAELKLLKKLPSWQYMESFIGRSDSNDGQLVNKEQFLLYTMFRDLDCNDLDDLRPHVNDQERRLHRLFLADGDKILTKPGFQATEHTGEANDFGIGFGLVAADMIFGTNEMDWKPISVKKTKDTDYIGSNGDIVIDLEVKGSFVDDPEEKPSAIGNHKKSIKDKKDAKGVVPQNTVRLGIISAIGTSGTPIVRIVDPPAEAADRSPRDLRLLNRVEFLSRWISCISPRSTLAIALRGRSQVLSNLGQIEELDGVALVTGSGAKIETSPYQFGNIHSRLFTSKSVVSDGPTGGIICRSGSGIFFLGLMDDLLKLAVEQNFETILDYQRRPGTVSKTVRCSIPEGRRAEFEGLGITWRTLDRNHVGFEAGGYLHYTAGGLAFGWLVA